MILPKKTFCLLVLTLGMLFCEPTQAQTHTYYHYFQGKKMILKEALDEVFVTFEKGTTEMAVMTILEKIPQIVLPNLGNLEALQYTLTIKLSSKTEQERDKIITQLKQATQVLAVYPTFYQEGKQKLQVDNRFLFQLKDGVNVSQCNNILQNHRVSLQKMPLGKHDVYVGSVPKDVNVFAPANQLQESGLCAIAEPNFWIEAQTHIIPNDSLFASQWYLNQANDADIDAPEAWDITTGTGNAVVAIMEGGFQITHPDISSNIVSPYNAFDDNNDPTPENPFARHGTPCIGLIAASSNNQKGVASIGYNLKVKPVKLAASGLFGWLFFNSIHLTQAANNIIITPHVVAVSNSFGSDAQVNWVEYSYLNIHNQCRNGLGAVILGSSGNSGSSNTISYPGGFDFAISVGASTPIDTKTDFSNASPQLDLVAPGVDIQSLDITGDWGYSATDYFPSFGGTSASCPIAAGIVGLMGSVNPNLTASTLATFLQLSCDKVLNYPYILDVGHPAGTWNYEIGHGRVNARKAVELASSSLNAMPVLPTNLVASLTNPSQITLQWVDNSPSETGFQIEYATSNNNLSFVALTTVAPNTTSFVINDANAIPYFYRVKVLGSANNTYSNIAQVISAPVALPATNISYDSFVAHWEAVPNATSYIIYVPQSNGKQYLYVGNETSFEIPNLYINSSYTYKVCAVNTFGNVSAYSNSISLTTLNIPTPTNFTASDMTPASFRLSWNAVPNAISYNLYIYEAPAITPQQINVNTTEAIITDLTPENWHLCYVAAKIGNATSNSAYLYLRTLPIPPVTAFPATELTAYTFRANWSSNQWADEYVLQVSVTNTFIPSVTTEYITTDTSFVITIPYQNLQYYRVIAKNKGYRSIPSNVIEVKIHQEIYFDTIPSTTYGDAPFKVYAFASTGYPIVFSSSDTSVAVVRSDSVFIVGAGEATITATQIGNDLYREAKASQALKVKKAIQTIDFQSIPTKKVNDPPFLIVATATSPGTPIEFESDNTNIALVSGDSIIIKGAGIAYITARRKENANYAQAEEKRYIMINKLTQNIYFESIQNQLLNAPNIKLRANASSGLPIRYYMKTEPDTGVAKLLQDEIIIIGLGKVSISAYQEGNDIYNPESSVRSFDIVYGKSLGVDVLLFPNPTQTGKVEIRGLQTIDDYKVQYTLLNPQGIILQNGFWTNNIAILDLQSYTESTYILILEGKRGKVKKKIIKL